MHVNFEFKARCRDLSLAESRLQSLHPRFIGTDHQVDTYFHVSNGRLKFREGNIEYALIHYLRPDVKGAKQSDVTLYHPHEGAALKELLSKALGVKTVVDKKRRIYFVDNVKFHFDEVQGLGSFLEVEAIDQDGSLGLDLLKSQCDRYADLLKVEAGDYETRSYSDLLMAKTPQ